MSNTEKPIHSRGLHYSSPAVLVTRPAATPLTPRDADVAASELEEARLQLGVLLETVEALQAGGGGDGRNDVVVGMATQLAAARAREGALQRRAGDLLVGGRRFLWGGVWRGNVTTPSA
jgi:hypothetical protein